MPTLEERERNLFNATDTLAQFYDEIESFFSILNSHMERHGCTASGERLRSGTFGVKNLPRRLVASITAIYIKGVEGPDDVDEDELDEDDGTEATATAGKIQVPITPGLRLPFVYLSLFRPKTIPTAQSLASPVLHLGAIGEITFTERKTGATATAIQSPTLPLSNLTNITLSNAKKTGDVVSVNCRPAKMKKYKMHARLVGYDNRKLLEIDSESAVKAIADTLVGFCET